MLASIGSFSFQGAYCIASTALSCLRRARRSQMKTPYRRTIRPAALTRLAMHHLPGNAIRGVDLVNFLIGLDGASTLTTTKHNKTTTTPCTVLAQIEEVDAHNERLEVCA